MEYSIHNVEEMDDPASALAPFIVHLSYESLPSKLIAHLRILLLDHIGVAAAGSASEGVGRVLDRLRDWGGKPEASVLFDGARLPAPNAALANGLLGHSVELDDIHPDAHVHSLSPVLPAAFAAAEWRGGCTGRDMIEAVAAGVETMCRLSLGAPVERGWHATATYGVYGAAAAAAKVLALNECAVRSALGIALSLSSGTRQPALEGSDVKRLHAGIAAANGVTAAMWAQDGISGPRSPFHGTYGHFAVFEGTRPPTEQIIAGLGERWEVLAVQAKRHACCAYCHAPIDAAIRLRECIADEIDDIADVTVYASAGAVDLVGTAFARKPATSSTAAQFSIPFVVASAFRFGCVGLDQFAPGARGDPRTARLARLVHAAVDRTIPDRALRPATVVVTLRDGRVFQEDSEHGAAATAADATQSAEESLRRGLAMLPSVGTTERATAIRHAVATLESRDVADLVELLLP